MSFKVVTQWSQLTEGLRWALIIVIINQSIVIGSIFTGISYHFGTSGTKNKRTIYIMSVRTCSHSAVPISQTSRSKSIRPQSAILSL